MKVMMLGWEFPPHFAGGVGVVCARIAGALADQGVDVTFVMPQGPEYAKVNKIRLLIANNLVRDDEVTYEDDSEFYQSYQSFTEPIQNINPSLKTFQGATGKLYGNNLMNEIRKFAAKCAMIAKADNFDVIHAHDWTTFPAAVAVKKATGKPMVVHVHITEFDKTGGMHADPKVYNIEKMGMDYADKIIAVSELVKRRLINQYFQDPNKIRVVYNMPDLYPKPQHEENFSLKQGDKLVMGLGRVTLQKGVDYFVKVAKRILEYIPNTRFVWAGTGDMLPQIIDQAGNEGILDRFMFPGFVTRQEGDKLYRMADLFIMPSVSEPFGVVPYEAMYADTPTIISKQSGVSEVLKNSVKCDFWDVEDMAAKALALLSYPSLRNHMVSLGYEEVTKYTWEKPAKECMNIYNELQGKWSA